MGHDSSIVARPYSGFLSDADPAIGRLFTEAFPESNDMPATSVQIAYVPAGMHAHDIVFRSAEPYSCVYVLVEKGGSAIVSEILSHASQAAHRTEVLLEDDAVAHVISLQIAAGTLSVTHRSSLGARAAMHWHNVTLGGEGVTHDLLSHVRGDDAQSFLDWVFYAKDAEKQSLSARNVFDARNGGGEMVMQGIAEGRGHVDCKGMIDIGLGGGGTDTYLTQHVLMLDATSKVDAIPGLEIKTNDVKASHSAIVSKVSDADLFYFASRGIAREEARKMYIEGFLEDLLAKIPDAQTRDEAKQAVGGKLRA